MPFTGSHPAAILPFARTAMPLSALTVGSMAPDLPFYVPVPYSSHLSHAFAGLATVDLAAGLVLYGFWMIVLRPSATVYLLPMRSPGRASRIRSAPPASTPRPGASI